MFPVSRIQQYNKGRHSPHLLYVFATLKDNRLNKSKDEVVRATNGNAHLANKVTVEGRSHYVDVGYGALLFEPLVLEEQPRFSRRGEEVGIVRISPNRYMMDRRCAVKAS